MRPCSSTAFRIQDSAEDAITLPDSPPSARATALVKLYPFVGPTIDQAAQAPGLAHRTTERGGLFATAWLVGHFAPSLVTRPRPAVLDGSLEFRCTLGSRALPPQAREGIALQDC